LREFPFREFKCGPASSSLAQPLLWRRGGWRVSEKENNVQRAGFLAIAATCFPTRFLLEQLPFHQEKRKCNTHTHPTHTCQETKGKAKQKAKPKRNQPHISSLICQLAVLTPYIYHTLVTVKQARKHKTQQIPSVQLTHSSPFTP
jgi:hypothetical protein